MESISSVFGCCIVLFVEVDMMIVMVSMAENDQESQLEERKKISYGDCDMNFDDLDVF